MRVFLGPEIKTLTERAIGTAYEVYNTLGQGIVGPVYQKALVHDLRERGQDVGLEVPSSSRTSSRC
ncbi:GxxExxY protein [Azospirillum thermophilum]|uniref:GxxExxY protein n=1 Tax=Azospirillum thermophilum TaxID=2202148 RepID=UPI001FE69560|nr:GxxExxY protein [Azospirillum thermophilum]